MGVLLGIFSFSVFAGNLGSGLMKIKKIEVWGANDFYLVPDKTVVNPASCTLTDKYVMPGTTGDAYRSMVLAAYIANENIAFAIYGDGCYGNRPQVVSVTLQRQ